jgi:hypothetical protein
MSLRRLRLRLKCSSQLLTVNNGPILEKWGGLVVNNRFSSSYRKRLCSKQIGAFLPVAL